MSRKLALLNSLIDLYRKQLNTLAIENDFSLTNGEILQKSQELDELIYEYLKLEAKENQRILQDSHS